MRISQILTDKRRRSVQLFIDGRAALKLDPATVERLSLSPGQVLSPSYLQYIRNEEIYSQAQKRALKLIQRRPHSTRELKDRLKKEFPENLLERLISDLTKAGWLNDRQTGAAWLEWYLGQKRKSRREIEAALRQRGFAQELTKELLSQIPLSQEEEILERLARKKLLIWQKRTQNPLKLYQKLGSYLSRKGFLYPAIKKTLNSLLGDKKRFEL